MLREMTQWLLILVFIPVSCITTEIQAQHTQKENALDTFQPLPCPQCEKVFTPLPTSPSCPGCGYRYPGV